MLIFLQIIGVLMAMPDIIITVVWCIRFPQRIKALSDTPISNFENEELYEVYRSKQFYKQLTKLLLINLPAHIISIVSFILYIVISKNYATYPIPILVGAFGMFCIAIPINILIDKSGKKYNIQVFNSFYKKLFPIGCDSKLLGIICLLAGYFVAETIACAVYMLLVMF